MEETVYTKGAFPNPETTHEEVAQGIANSANDLCTVTDNVFIPAITPRFPTEKQKEKRSLSVEELSRHTKANKHLYNLTISARWGYRDLTVYLLRKSHERQR